MVTGRNDACPCGSGKRYKHCHGALDPGGATTDEAHGRARRLDGLMQAALQQQIRNEHAAADRLYAEALEMEPRNFDALHMQGVIAYQLRQFHRAEALIRAALEILPGVEAALQNLQLVLSAQALDNELCSAMLPALAAACDSRLPHVNGVVNLIEFSGKAAVPGRASTHSSTFVAEIAAAWTGACPLCLWRQGTDGRLAVPSGSATAAATGLPRAGLFVLIGTVDVPGAWYDDARPEAAVVVLLDARPCAAYDQIRAASRELTLPTHLWYADLPVANAMALPGNRGDGATLARALNASCERRSDR